jgi:hypothetical protein
MVNQYGQASNLGGVTFIFDMDYMTRTVDISFSICSIKENFCKAIGISVAEEPGVERVLMLDQFQKYANIEGIEGFVPAYLNFLMSNQMNDSNSNRETLLLEKLKEHEQS